MEVAEEVQEDTARAVELVEDRLGHRQPDGVAQHPRQRGEEQPDVEPLPAPGVPHEGRGDVQVHQLPAHIDPVGGLGVEAEGGGDGPVQLVEEAGEEVLGPGLVLGVQQPGAQPSFRQFALHAVRHDPAARQGRVPHLGVGDAQSAVGEAAQILVEPLPVAREARAVGEDGQPLAGVGALVGPEPEHQRDLAVAQDVQGAVVGGAQRLAHPLFEAAEFVVGNREGHGHRTFTSACPSGFRAGRRRGRPVHGGAPRSGRWRRRRTRRPARGSAARCSPG